MELQAIPQTYEAARGLSETLYAKLLKLTHIINSFPKDVKGNTLPAYKKTKGYKTACRNFKATYTELQDNDVYIDRRFHEDIVWERNHS